MLLQLRAGKYKTVQEWRADIQLIWDNARKYNGEHHPVSIQASKLQVQMDKRWQDAVETAKLNMTADARGDPRPRKTTKPRTAELQSLASSQPGSSESDSMDEPGVPAGAAAAAAAAAGRVSALGLQTGAVQKTTLFVQGWQQYACSCVAVVAVDMQQCACCQAKSLRQCVSKATCQHPVPLAGHYGARAAACGAVLTAVLCCGSLLSAGDPPGQREQQRCSTGGCAPHAAAVRLLVCDCAPLVVSAALRGAACERYTESSAARNPHINPA